MPARATDAARHTEALAAREAAEQAQTRLVAERDDAGRARERVERMLATERSALAAIERERDTLRAERDALALAREATSAEQQRLVAERDEVRAERDTTAAERDRLVQRP